MPDIVLKDRDGSAMIYKGVVGVKTLNIEGELETFYGKENARPADCLRVTFMNGDQIHYVRSVAEGDNCANPVERGLVAAPTKESNEQYDYTFYSWGAEDGGAADDTILNAVTVDKTVYAIFAATVRYYTITYLDDDAIKVLYTEQLAYGTFPSYTPEKSGMKFDGWEQEVVAVTGNATYTAKWTEAEIGTLIFSQSVKTTAGLSGYWLYISGLSLSNYTSLTQKYKVIWDGVEYILTAKYCKFVAGSTSSKRYILGNPYSTLKMGGKTITSRTDASTGVALEDTGEPFTLSLGSSEISVFTTSAVTVNASLWEIDDA